jgi:2-iminobutanoate/2-iminopropanoate deaminase
VFVSGQGSVENGEIVADTFAGEMRRSIENVARILSAAGLDFTDVVQVRSYVRNPSDLAEYNKIYCEFFKAPFPARTTLTNCLPEFLKFEIDVVAQVRE